MATDGVVVDLTSGLYQFMIDSERLLLRAKKMRREELQSSLQQRLQIVIQRYQASQREVNGRFSSQVKEIHLSLTRFRDDLRKKRVQVDSAWAHWHTISRHYEALLAQAKQLKLPQLSKARIAHLKPRNINRNIFHLLVGLTCVLTYELILTKWQLIAVGGAALILFSIMDIGRRVSTRWNDRFVDSMFGKISRPGEAHRIPSATWYTLALFIGAIVYPQHGIELAALVLAAGDPAASLLGKRWGKKKIIGEKSWAGAAGFVLAASAIGVAFLAIVRPEMGWTILPVALGAATVGAMMEVFTGKLDDNFTIPLAVGLFLLPIL